MGGLGAETGVATIIAPDGLKANTPRLLPASHPPRYGDFAAGILAIIARVALLKRASRATAAVWVFNVWGAADLLFAFYQGPRLRLDPGALGAAFFIPTTVGPPSPVTHALIFGLLLQSKH